MAGGRHSAAGVHTKYGSPAAQPASGSTLIYLHKTFRRPELQPNKEGNVTYDVIPCMGL